MHTTLKPFLLLVFVLVLPAYSVDDQVNYEEIICFLDDICNSDTLGYDAYYTEPVQWNDCEHLFYSFIHILPDYHMERSEELASYMFEVSGEIYNIMYNYSLMIKMDRYDEAVIYLHNYSDIVKAMHIVLIIMDTDSYNKPVYEAVYVSFFTPAVTAGRELEEKPTYLQEGLAYENVVIEDNWVYIRYNDSTRTRIGLIPAIKENYVVPFVDVFYYIDTWSEYREQFR